MKKVNTTYWKTFKVEDLFEILKGSTKYGKKDITEDGHIPVYSSETDNNGIIGYCKKKPTYLVNESHPLYLIFGDHTCAFHIANSDFCVADNVKILLPKNQHLSIKSVQFISTIWKAGIPNLGYSRHWSVAKKVLIPLPSTSDGSPDWQYMEDYMRRIEQRTQTAISAFVSSKYSSRKIDTTYWRPFPIGKFFDFQRGKVKKLQSLEKGNVPVIAAARNKQGVAGYYGVEPSYKDQITISCNGVGCGSTFYHDYPFNVNGDAIVSIDKMHISAKAKQFICCILDGVLTRKYSYEEKCSPEKASNEKILLPATPAGEPDWRYMEMYMRGVEAIAKEKISLLTRKNQESNNKTEIHYHINAENISLQTEGTINIGEINEK